MVRRKTPPQNPTVPTELLVGREEARYWLEERIEKGREMRNTQIGSMEQFEAAKNAYSKWNSFNTELLKTIFTTEELADEYGSCVGVGVVTIYDGPSLGEEIADLFENIDKKIHRLDSIVERLELIPPADQVSSGTHSTSPQTQVTRSNKVVIVQGHDELVGKEQS